MPIIFDFTSDNPRLHEQYDYPESNDRLEAETNRLFSEALRARESGGDFEVEKFTKLHAHITELRERGYDISSDKEDVLL